jgi:hypothetical protein
MAAAAAAAAAAISSSNNGTSIPNDNDQSHQQQLHQGLIVDHQQHRSDNQQQQKMLELKPLPEVDSLKKESVRASNRERKKKWRIHNEERSEFTILIQIYIYNILTKKSPVK